MTVPNVGPHTVNAHIPAGGKRGVVISMHGLSVIAQPIPPLDPVDSNTFLGSFYDLTFQNSLNADHWVEVQVPYPEDFYAIPGAQAIHADIANDSGAGSRYKNTTLHWWDHVVAYVHANFGQWPIVAYGGSWGGWHTLQVASNRAADIVGYMAIAPATNVQNVLPAFTPGVSFGNQPSPGLDVGPHALDLVTKPGIIGYGTSDFVVGWGSAVQATTGIDVTTFAGAGVLPLVDSSKIVSVSSLGPLIRLVTYGGLQTATISYTGISGNNLTGCTLVYGSGVTIAGQPAMQNNTDAIITNAVNAGRPVTRHAGIGDDHEFTSGDATAFAAWLASTIDPSCPAIH